MWNYLLELANCRWLQQLFWKLYRTKEGFNAAATFCSEQLNDNFHQRVILSCYGIGKLRCYKFGKSVIVFICNKQ